MAELSPTELRAGTVIFLNNAPCLVLRYEHNKMGRGGATVRVKLRNLRSQAIFEVTFRGNERVEEAEIERKRASYLYRDGSRFIFMDSETFEQFSIPAEIIAEQEKWLKEGAEVTLINFQSQPLAVSLPIKMDFEVIETEPGIKGNSVANLYKSAKIETGAVVSVPLFIKTGDIIRINTEEGIYVERVKR